MRRIGQRLSDFSLSKKILAACILLLIMNSALAGVLCYTYVTKDTLKNFYQSSDDLISQINIHLNERIYDMSRRVEAVNSNGSIDSLHKAVDNNDIGAYTALQSEMADLITEWGQSDDYISSIYIYTPLGSFENYTHFKYLDFDFEKSILFSKFEENPKQFAAWYPAMKSPVFRDMEVVIPAVYKVKMNNTYGYYIISLSQKKIQDYLENTYSSYDYLFIVDENGSPITEVPEGVEEIIHSFQNNRFNSHISISKEMDYKGKHYLATFSKVQSNHWQIYGLRSQESLTGHLTRFRSLILLILALCVIASGFVIAVIVYGLTSPLMKLTSAMDETAKTKNFHMQFIYEGNDEIGKLTSSFNSLIHQLDAYISALEAEKDYVKQVQTQKRKAEIKALQMQINPHFLYNTLNAIAWEAVEHEDEEISMLATSLGKFFRIVLSKGQEVIELNEEIEQVESYLKIQKIRYENILDYSISVDESLIHKKMVKLVIQPLVENAIYHGIKPSGRNGKINISVSQKTGENGQELFWIVVEDDGVGMEPHKLQKINNLLSIGTSESELGYGIFNVNERIKLYYGSEYGLMYESVLGQWAKATLTFPTELLEEEL